MRFKTETSPHLPGPGAVNVVMGRVLLALAPGALAMVAFFGWGVLVNIVLACVVALASEAAMLRLRGRPLRPFLTDLSALITAVLLALALPQLAPWWLTTIGVAFALIFGKHIYGGLGYNPFNPAMLGYVVLLISFPREMTLWMPPLTVAADHLSLGQTLQAIFTGHLPHGLTMDSLSMATPLDALKTQLGLDHTVSEIHGGAIWGSLAGKGWEWINLLFLGGGLWMIHKRVIGWQIPLGLLGALGVLAFVFWAGDPDLHGSPLYEWLSGGAMLGAFFVATDPISAATTPRGRLIYGFGIGTLTYVIRTWGGYPDGIAFAVLLMNMAAPLIDNYTRPRVYGH